MEQATVFRGQFPRHPVCLTNTRTVLLQSKLIESRRDVRLGI
jgi:hypothetical protein